MALPIIIGAASGLLLPLISEILRTKPDPEVAKSKILAARQEYIDRGIGEGLNEKMAEKRADKEIAAAMAQADKAGEFNTPWGEMVVGGVLGGVGGALLGKGIGAAASKLKGVGAGAKSASAGAPGAAAAPAGIAAPFPGAVTEAELAPLVSKAEFLSKRSPGAFEMKQARALAPFPGNPMSEADIMRARMYRYEGG